LEGPGRVLSRLEAMDEHCQRCAQEIGAGGFDVLLVGACQEFRVAPIAQYVDIPSVIYLHEPYRALYEAFPALPWSAPAPPARWTPRAVAARIRDGVRTEVSRVQ